MSEPTSCNVELKVTFSNGDEVEMGFGKLHPDVGLELVVLLQKHRIPSIPASPGPDKTTA